ncbi:hypothetical protein CDL12_00296 [Handroanthus impetiginosus]|uniref:CCHC-type domain-containing protein n=1 Tax=Handroanthus impetiginosus TaxID=429701 RepID=A0A2G9IB18_9LAMI|nr:hypothetical protein CDL12_00296 [Handroanthus impetiginosus]
MANLAKFEFVPLDISGKNYLSWVVDAKMHLNAMGLENTIVEKNKTTIQNRVKAMIFLRHHLDESLKIEYLTQYREKGFKKYSELISCLLVAEQNNELLMKNRESRPTGSSPFPETNAINFSNFGRGRGRNHGRGRGRDIENLCFRCDSKGHWSRICRTPKHLVELYQASLKKKNESVEANFTNSINNFDNDNDTNDTDITHLDVANFFEHPEDKIDHLIGNENIQRN